MEETSLTNVPQKQPESGERQTTLGKMARRERLQVWVQRLWCIAAVQEGVESWLQAWLVDKFRSPVMCRVVVRDDRWCKVPSLTHPMMHQVPAWQCAYDPWCDALVFSETAPPLLTRLTVLLVAFIVSLLVVWASRLLTYRPTNTILIWARRNTPRLVLVMVAAGAMIQMGLDHFFLPLVLPHTVLLTRIVSFITFFSTTLFLTAVLAIKIKQSNLQPHSTHQLKQHHRDTTPQHKREKFWEEHTNIYGASYVLPDVCRHMVTDNLL